MAFPAAVYAIPARATVTTRDNVVPFRRPENTPELRTKRAIDRTHKILDRLDARIEDYNFQIAAFERGKKILAARKQRIEEETLRRMSAAQVEHLDGLVHQFDSVPCPAAVAVDDEKLIPAEYIRPPKPGKPAPDKVAIKVALERDKDLIIPGVHLTQGVRLARK